MLKLDPCPHPTGKNEMARSTAARAEVEGHPAPTSAAAAAARTEQGRTGRRRVIPGSSAIRTSVSIASAQQSRADRPRDLPPLQGQARDPGAR